MNSLILYIIIAIAGMTAIVPVMASERLKIGDYAIVRFVRRKGSTTQWKKGAKVKILDEHVGKDIGIGVESDYTVIMENEDIAFPTEEQLEKIEDIHND